MKKILVLPGLFISCLLIMSFRPTAIPFEGSVQYETNITGDAPKAITDRIAKQYELSYKGSDMKIKGTLPLRGVFLIKKSTARMYIIRADKKDIYEVDLHDKRLPANPFTPQVTRLKETLTIAGYSCQKYEIVYGKGVKVFAWTTSSIQVDPSGFSPLAAAQLQLPPSVEGFLLKLQFVTDSFTLTCTATSVKPAALNASEFILPSGMTLKKL